jgi:hypothetical protein
MKKFPPTEKQEIGESNPFFGICPRCQGAHFLSVPTKQWGMICLYCLHDLYPPNGLSRSLEETTNTHQERTLS